MGGTTSSAHMNLDRGSLGVENQLQNLRAVREGTRVFSAYELRHGTRICIITEVDRTVALQAARELKPREAEELSANSAVRCNAWLAGLPFSVSRLTLRSRR